MENTTLSHFTWVLFQIVIGITYHLHVLAITIHLANSPSRLNEQYTSAYHNYKATKRPSLKQWKHTRQ